MLRFIFVSQGGERIEIEAPTGTSAMYAAVSHGIEGIVGECGGSLACGTCHVYVDPDRLAALPGPSTSENEMLDMTAAERRGNSRLSCQILMAETLDGIELELPARQT